MQFSIHSNQITDEVADSIAEIIVTQTKLELLLLSNNILEDKGIGKITDALLLKPHCTLRIFHLCNTGITQQTVGMLAAVLEVRLLVIAFLYILTEINVCVNC